MSRMWEKKPVIAFLQILHADFCISTNFGDGCLDRVVLRLDEWSNFSRVCECMMTLRDACE